MNKPHSQESAEHTPDMRNRPEQDTEKIRSMFNRISGAYDLLNRLLTFGIDQRWRNKAIRALGSREELAGLRCLDLCAGTCDMTLELLRQSAGKVGKISAVDFSPEMLRLAKVKLKKKAPQANVTLIEGDATALPFDSESFDRAMVAFGIRNVRDVPRALAEVHRTLKPNGVFAILEFSQPESALIRRVYTVYFKYILPRIGALISGDGEAYRYLNESAEAFPDGENFARLLTAAGFSEVSHRPLTFGVVTLYLGRKTP